LAHSNASKNKDIKILALRLDMSYAIDDIFIDKYTKVIKNIDFIVMKWKY
jgi:hypothetical protein